MPFKAHPTTHAAARFRSRLEAKWAAFFDHAGWEWEYEPFDLDGWVPDFLLRGSKENILIEVKPIEWTGDSVRQQIADRRDLSKACRPDREVLILGAYPLGTLSCSGWQPWPFAIGCWATPVEGEDARHWFDEACLTTNPDDGTWDVAALNGSYHNRLSGHYDGNLENSPHHDDIRRAWREAGNTTQWKAR